MHALIFFSDLDGTLLHSDNSLSNTTLQAIKKVKNHDDLFVPISSRLPESIQSFIPCEAPIVAHNGAMIILEDKIISYTIPTQTAYDICSYCNDLDWNIYDGNNWYSTNQYFKDHSIEESYIGKTSIKIELEDIKKIQTIHKIVCIGSIDTVTSYLEETYSSLHITRSASYYLEITNIEATKSNALKTVANHYQIPLENTIAFGDYYNDEDMLEMAGVSYVVDNAPDDLKQKVDHVTLSNNDDGVAVILNQFYDKESL
ncbi:Cof-type HAD-IIB family hydrolase [uncultured Catenibacterium sp.]|uniref:Cof-type HAD-IIB family hydrolase n=2 Tax=uncultured Catenibacterium sp. TaxID=286142 RepID=UPI0025F92DC1|nr:Cof-type HAD-IIB family hydrolase [uncultured Catenibacterium sp.]